MQTITTIGFDIAKSVFQVHGVDSGGQVVIRRQLKRRYVLAFFQKLSPCLVGIEACASAHHWSRELRALGHTVRLIPPAFGYGTNMPVGGDRIAGSISSSKVRLGRRGQSRRNVILPIMISPKTTLIHF